MCYYSNTILNYTNLNGENIIMKNNTIKGITLIALIITVIVMLILAGVAISSLTGNGIFSKVSQATFKSNITALQEEASTYVSSELLSLKNPTDVNAGYENLQRLSKYYPEATDLGTSPTIDTALNGKLKDKVIIYQGEFYYIYDPEDKSDQDNVKWCFDVGIKVWGFSDFADFQENLPEEIYVQDGSNQKQKGVYMCIPDLTGFSQLNTRYVSYDESGNEQIDTWINKNPPNNWYDYKNQQWANILVENNGKEAYFVWIPRYVYKISSVNPQIADVKFVDLNNNYTDPDTDQVTDWATLQSQGYVLSEAFIWSDKENDTSPENQLSGYWMSKYVLNDTTTLPIDMNVVAGDTSIQITNVTFPTSGGLSASKVLTYEYYINTKLIKSTTSPTEVITKTELIPGTEYTINLTAKDSLGQLVASMTKTVRTSIVNPPDLTGFNPDCTYYLTYDENGNEIRTPITQSPPQDWYDYTNKKWANIVVTGNGKVAYFVWIPRYEYRLMNPDKTASEQYADVVFIPVTQITPDNGYIISEAFIWSDTESDTAPEKQLSGYWMSKYVLSL